MRAAEAGRLLGEIARLRKRAEEEIRGASERVVEINARIALLRELVSKVEELGGEGADPEQVSALRGNAAEQVRLAEVDLAAARESGAAWAAVDFRLAEIETQLFEQLEGERQQ